METHSLTSEFKTDLPKNTAFKLKLKREVERRKAPKWNPASVQNIWGRSRITTAKGQKAAWVLSGIDCRDEEG